MLKNSIAIQLFLFAYVSISAQTFDTIQLKYARTITATDLKKHLEIIASDEYEGREASTEGEKKTTKYISETYSSFGIKPMEKTGFFQKFPLYPTLSDKSTIEANGVRYSFKNDFFYMRASDVTPIDFDEITFCGYGIADEKYDDYASIGDLKGKVIMILDGEPKISDSLYLISESPKPGAWTLNPQKKYATAKEKEVKAVLVIVRDYDKTVQQFSKFFDHPSLSLSNGNKENVAVFYISEKMANAILTKQNKNRTTEDLVNTIYKTKKTISFKQSIDKGKINYNLNNTEVFAENVLGFIEGTDLKNEVIVISAHIDHLGVRNGKVYNGADDDGSGTVSLMELAQAFMKAKEEGRGPRRSILFIGFTGEEKGLLGSKFYTSNPVIPLENTVCNLNIDMVGRIDEAHKDSGAYVYLIGSDMLSKKLHNVSEEANKRFCKLKLDYTYNDPEDKNRYYYRSDHYNFAKNNIPVIFYFNGVHEDYHKETDEISKIDFNMMAQRVKLVFHTAWEIANMDERIKSEKKKE